MKSGTEFKSSFIVLGLFLIYFLYNNAFAAATNYNCYARTFKIELILEDLNTQIVVSDRQSREVYFQDFTREMYRVDELTKFKFESRSASENILTFKTVDMKNPPIKLFGFIDGNFNGPRFNDSIACQKL